MESFARLRMKPVVEEEAVAVVLGPGPKRESGEEEEAAAAAEEGSAFAAAGVNSDSDRGDEESGIPTIFSRGASS